MKVKIILVLIFKNDQYDGSVMCKWIAQWTYFFCLLSYALCKRTLKSKYFDNFEDMIKFIKIKSFLKNERNHL